LVVIPLSTRTGWVEAFQNWCPKLKVVCLSGSKEERKVLVDSLLNDQSQFDVLIVTYEISIREDTFLAKIKWEYIVVDEAHKLKNEKCMLGKSLRQLKCNCPLLLTGTPLQNNLLELWSLLNFIIPDIFKSAESFMEWFEGPFSGDINFNAVEKEAVLDRLHRVLRPFVLRRTKTEVLKELVGKQEIVVSVPLSGPQKAMYDQIEKFNGFRIHDKQKRYDNASNEFKKIATHPWIYRKDEYEITNDIITVSGKFVFLDRLIPKMHEFGHRMLFFCQSTRIMDLLSEYLDYRHEKYFRLDGSVPGQERERILEKFNRKDAEENIFMLSTRAGGLGVNLQTADTVVILTSDWNPQADLQAMARAHRIGQKNQVKVLRLVSNRTVEEKIISRAQHKLNTAKDVIDMGIFDMSAPSEERKKEQEKLWNQSHNVVQETAEDWKVLNKLIARSKKEEKRFNEMDRQKKKYDWQQINKQKKLPSFIKKFIPKTKKDLILPDDLQRKRMKRDFGDMATEEEVEKYCSPEESDEEKAEESPRKRQKLRHDSQPLLGRDVNC